MRAFSFKQAAAIFLFLLFCAQARADLSIEYTWGPTNLNVNETISYTVKVSNTNALVILTPTVVSEFPSTATLVSATNVPSSAVVTTITTTNSGRLTFEIGRAHV